MASLDPEKQCRVFFLAVTQLFGMAEPPLNFTMIPDFICRVFFVFFAIPVIHCVDDVIVIELLKFVLSGFASWRVFAYFVAGICLTKSPPPSRGFRALGAIFDITEWPSHGPVLICPAEDRTHSLRTTLLEFLDEQ